VPCHLLMGEVIGRRDIRASVKRGHAPPVPVEVLDVVQCSAAARELLRRSFTRRHFYWRGRRSLRMAARMAAPRLAREPHALSPGARQMIVHFATLHPLTRLVGATMATNRPLLPR
jgi:hypothetical protein